MLLCEKNDAKNESKSKGESQQKRARKREAYFGSYEKRHNKLCRSRKRGKKALRQQAEFMENTAIAASVWDVSSR